MTGDAVMGGGGVAHGAVLIRFATAVLGDCEAELAAARTAVADAMGAAALSDTAAVAALFNAIDRVADATGTPLEGEKAAATADFRSAIGIDDFADASEKGASA